MSRNGEFAPLNPSVPSTTLSVVSAVQCSSAVMMTEWDGEDGELDRIGSQLLSIFALSLIDSF